MEVAIRVRVSGCGALGTGSGFALSDGLVVTNRHVAAGADEVQLSTWDGRSMEASGVTMALHQDLALLVLDDGSSPVRAAHLADHDPAPGTPVYVVGYPLGEEVEVQQTKIVDYVDGPRLGVPGNAMRLATTVQPGNSGGPVLDADGQVVGVVYGVETATSYALATPASAVRTLEQRTADEEPPAPSC